MEYKDDGTPLEGTAGLIVLVRGDQGGQRSPENMASLLRTFAGRLPGTTLQDLQERPTRATHSTRASHDSYCPCSVVGHDGMSLGPVDPHDYRLILDFSRSPSRIGMRANRMLHVARRRENPHDKFFLEGEAVLVKPRRHSDPPMRACIADPKITPSRRTVRIRFEEDGKEVDESVDVISVRTSVM